MKTWMYVALFLIFLASAFAVKYYFFPSFDLTASATLLVGKAQSFITWGTQNIGALLAIITPFTGIILVIANKAYTNYKTAKNLEVTQVKNDLLASGNENFKLTQTVQEKEQQLQTMTGELEAYKTGAGNLGDLMNKVKSLEEMNTRYSTERNLLQQQVKDLNGELAEAKALVKVEKVL